MSPEEQPTILTPPPNGSRPAPVGWQAPSVEEMQAKLPQYEVLEVLGRGGMGAVYKARQKSLKRLVAIKILPLGLADDEFKFAERFQNEAQTMAAMNHPAIVSVYDFGETSDGLLYFIMEFVDGTDVQKMIQGSGRLSGEHALAITAHVCDALAYAHARGVIHRDIKPANILINQDGHIKVADFGLAKMSDPAQTSGLTKTNMAMGTPDYVAPEVLSPGMVADHRADLYAVGVMLYQMLTGEVPRGMFKLPSQKGIGSDPRFDEIICKAMEHDREERYQSAMDVRQALDVILATPQAKDDGIGNARTAASSLALSAGVSARITNKPAALWLSIGGSVAVLGIAGLFIFGGSSNTNPDPASASASASAARESQPTIKMQENGMSHPDLPPQISVWRDVTAEARETAKTNPSLVVTEKGIEKQGDAANPRLLITPPGQRDQAVRMRYTGYGQVDLHGSDRGFLYVMAQPNQTIFHSQASGSSAPPVKLIPNKLHPPGFDPKQPHELLVTIEGTRLRAWVDGRFAGEAKADTYTEGVTGLIITPETIVHQVELGEFR